MRTLGVSLSPEEVRVLREAGAEVKVIATGVVDRYDVETAQHVGTIVGPSIRVVISPKITMPRVLYLMGYATDALRFGASTRLAHEADLLVAMQALFANALERALYGGLVRDYRTFDAELVAPRGRIDAMRVFTRRAGIFPPVDCSSDEYTADTEANRRLLAAARRLSRGSLGLSPAGARIRGMLGRFEEVGDLVVDARRLQPVRLDRRGKRYAPALAYADLILRNASVELRHGHTDAITFLVNMNVVYENFVVRALEPHVAVAGTRWTHHPAGLHLDEEQVFLIEPDALWATAAGEPLLVVDAKYKTIAQGLVDDAYQMLAYCTALGLRRGVLIYAGATPQRHRIRNTTTEIVIACLDPRGEPAEIEARVATLAAELRALAPNGALS
jgi:5-methylcytosine-specific restriction enzyme subunit McrC